MLRGAVLLVEIREQLLEEPLVPDGSITAESLDFDRASVQKFDLPSLARRRNDHHVGVSDSIKAIGGLSFIEGV
jgi:hypothetical protein